MALNSNLSFARDFLLPITQFCAEEYEKTWSAENRVRYSSRLEELIEANVVKDTIITIKPSFVKDFTSKEKCFIYEVLRLASIEDPRLRYLMEDLRGLLRQRGYQNDRYFYLESLTDNQFAYEIDCKLTPRTESRRSYYRKLSGKFGKQKFTLQEILSKYFFTDFIELQRRKPKKKIRHKGYRDHGSLGSEFSRTLKQQAGDWSIRESEERKIKKKQDIIDFLQGFAGWI
jgi:hypothetical protein